VTTDCVENNTVACEFFRPIGNGPFPGVIVLHILGGDFELSRTICRTFASNGIGALFLKMPYYGPRRPRDSKRRMISPDLDETVDGMTQAVLDIRRATAWLGSQTEIDEDRLGITGISLGGIVGCLAAANEPRLVRSCFVLAGGDLPVIVMESDEMTKVRDHYEGQTVDRERAVELLAQVDPLSYAEKLSKREVLMFNATKDKVVPRACTEKLWRAMGKPRIEWWNADHYSSIFYLPKGLVTITRFFGEASWGTQ
jgi:dienelactone hydrolase